MATEGVTRQDLIELDKLATDHGVKRERLGEVRTTYTRVTRSGVSRAEYDAALADEIQAWREYRRLSVQLMLKATEGEKSMPTTTLTDRPQIQTLEELEALPDATVVVEDGADHQVYQKLHGDHWSGDARSWDTGQIRLPVTVIWRPEA